MAPGLIENNARSRASAAVERPAAEDWSCLVERIRLGEHEGMEELYRMFSKGVRYYLCHHLGPQELDDRVHDTFVTVVQAIRRGDLRDPERLMGFVHTIVKRQISAHVEQAVRVRENRAGLESGGEICGDGLNPEESIFCRQKEQIMERLLQETPRRDREILTRFYLLGENRRQICSEMKLSYTQYRLLKSRAKARFAELGKKTLGEKFFEKI